MKCRSCQIGLIGNSIVLCKVVSEYCDIARARLAHWLAVVQQELNL